MIKNAKQFPRRYYGLHMVEGVAEYSDGSEPYRILINEATIKNMDPSFSGKPVYVKHVEEVDLEKLGEEMDGLVVRSFFNQADGKHWVEFMVTTDKGHDAIAKGFKLSNAYVPSNFGSGGKWHNVDYAKEVLGGEYDHLAIVPNPRYEESIILTPEEFKAYNSNKEQELRTLANSKEKVSMFKFFKKTKVEDGSDIAGTTVVLKSGRELTIEQLVNEAEAKEDKKDEKKENMEPPKEEPKPEVKPEKSYANGDHFVKVGEKEMSVNELVNAYQSAMKNDESSEDSEDGMENEDDEKKDKEKEKKENDNFDSIQNADKAAPSEEEVLEIQQDRLARGKARYGSTK